MEGFREQIRRLLQEWELLFLLLQPFTAFSLLVGTGGAPLCSIARGKGDEKRAEHIMGNSFLMTLVMGVVLLGMGLLVKEPLLYALGASPATFAMPMIISVFIFWVRFL